MANFGPPITLDAEKSDLIEYAIRIGATRAGAAAHAGVARTTLFEWIRRGKLGEEPFAALWLRIRAADRSFEVRALARIDAAGMDPKHWTANAWLLERRLPRYYTRRQQIDDAKIEKLVEDRIAALIAEARADRDKPAEPKQLEASNGVTNERGRSHDGE